MIELKNIFFGYNENVVIDDVSLAIPKGQNIAIIGESGCGKSTLLKLIYGLYDLNKGTISYNKKPILGPKFNLIPGEDYIKYLAQDFDLMPYITVEENVGKFLSNIYKDKKKARIQELLEMVEMTDFAKVKVRYLSGGQQQRVALATVLALEPEIILLDEPFSQIDTCRKNSLRRNLFRYLKENEITCIIATHDSTDALSFSDEVLVMKNGKNIAKNTPKRLFENPSNKYIASLFGEVNEIPICLINASNDSHTMILAYAHELRIAEESNFVVEVKQSYFRGNHFLVEALYDNQILFFENFEEVKTGTKVSLSLKK